MPRRVAELSYPLAPLPGAVGGVWLAGDSPKHCRRALNVRAGVVRPGSTWLFTLAGFYPATNGGYNYQSARGAYFNIFAGWNVGGAFEVRVVSGATTVKTTTVAAVTAPRSDVVCTWGAIGNKVVMTGPTGGVIVVVEFKDTEDIDIRAAGSSDRSVAGNGYGAGDDAAPYHHAQARARVLTVHQRRVVYVDEDGIIRWSNLEDPDALPVNNFLLVADGRSFDRCTALVSVNDGNLLIAERDSMWLGSGSMSTSEVGGFSVRQVAFGLGITSAASVQVLGAGQVLALSERGPFRWISGAYVVMGSQDSDLGGGGSIYPLFRPEYDVDLDLERYRPPPAALGVALSRYSLRQQRYDLALGSYVDAGDDLEHRRLRLCFDLRSKMWSMEWHQPAVALFAGDDGHDDEVLWRVDGFGNVYVDDLGDEDDVGDALGKPPEPAAIPSQIQFQLFDAGPLRGRVLRLFLELLNNWRSTLTVAVNHDNLSSHLEETITVDVGGDAAVLHGFRLGRDELPTETVKTEPVGLPPLAAGRLVRVEIRGDGARWGLRSVTAEVDPGEAP